MELPREATTLEGFECWNRQMRVPEQQEAQVAFVSIRINGIIMINRAAYEMFGSPAAVQLMFDQKLRRIGLKPVDSDDCKTFYVLSGSAPIVACKKFLDYYEVPLTVTRRYTPKFIDGVLVVDL